MKNKQPVFIGSLLLVIIITIKFMPAFNSYKDKGETMEIISTSESGNKLKKIPGPGFTKVDSTKKIKATFIINPEIKKQKIIGIGSSFTESSAFVLAHLSVEKRKEVMEEIYGKNGAGFSLTRTHIGSSDFSVEGKYSYAEIENDIELKGFTLAKDKQGFSREKFKKVQDESYDLLPMIKEALEINPDIRIIASPWTAPAWMKDNDNYFGGKLQEKYYEVYSKYLIKYLEEYKKEGVDIWGLTPVNEPEGNNAQWESMHFNPLQEKNLIKKFLGPAMDKFGNNGFDDEKVRLLVFDQNRDNLMKWTDEFYGDGDSQIKKYVYGTAIHWYSSTFMVYEESLRKVYEKYPEYAIIHTEGCIDNLGISNPDIKDPKYNERVNGKAVWFNNDRWWWNKNATDWAFEAWAWAGPWVKPDDHPIYAPVHRYARDIIVSLNNWVSGWVDWNIVLNKDGGPNHVGNFCGAPIMIDIDAENPDEAVYFTPVFTVLKQLSRSIRPGDFAVQTEKRLYESMNEDDIHAVATINSDNVLSVNIINTTKSNLEYQLVVGDNKSVIEIEGNSLQTVKIQM